MYRYRGVTQRFLVTLFTEFFLRYVHSFGGTLTYHPCLLLLFLLFLPPSNDYVMTISLYDLLYELIPRSDSLFLCVSGAPPLHCRLTTKRKSRNKGQKNKHSSSSSSSFPLPRSFPFLLFPFLLLFPLLPFYPPLSCPVISLILNKHLVWA